MGHFKSSIQTSIQTFQLETPFWGCGADISLKILNTLGRRRVEDLKFAVKFNTKLA